MCSISSVQFVSVQENQPVFQRASDQIYHILLERITSGAYAPGEKIPTEKSLCEEFGVSRVTVRAVIDRLRGVGLLRSQRGSGTYVHGDAATGCINSLLPFAVLDAPSRIDMFEFRRIIEVESVGLAAMRAEPEMIRKLRDTVTLMRETDDPNQIARCDLEFHYLLAQASRNSFIIKTFEVFKDLYLTLFEQNTRLLSAYGAEAHRRLCQYIEMRDVENAKRCMAEHLNETLRHTKDFSL